jgi:hypothetical protein
MLLRDCGGKFQSSSLKMNENCAVHYFSLPATEHRQTRFSMKCIAMRHTERGTEWESSHEALSTAHRIWSWVIHNDSPTQNLLRYGNRMGLPNSTKSSCSICCTANRVHDEYQPEKIFCMRLFTLFYAPALQLSLSVFGSNSRIELSSRVVLIVEAVKKWAEASIKEDIFLLSKSASFQLLLIHGKSTWIDRWVINARISRSIICSRI